MKKIYIVIGTRPNFVKVTQFKEEAAEHFPHLDIKLIHTGQHYDAKMADVFFEQFNLVPDYYLNISPGKPTIQIAHIIIKLDELCDEIGKPDLMLVVGDVNSTLAASIFANKAGIKFGHIESGLRSFDRTMPEEINRLLTDEIADYYFVTEQSGLDHLAKEGKDPNKIHFVGNTMIDTLVSFTPSIDQNNIVSELKLKEDQYVLMTMHRPATVDEKEGQEKLLDIIKEISKEYPVVFPIHPRTKNKMKEFGLLHEYDSIDHLIFCEPLDYFAFQKLIKHAAVVITDSGGIQEETTFLLKPCLTLRPNTERPITCSMGTNTLLQLEKEEIIKQVAAVKNQTYKRGSIPPNWDGKATYRILQVVNQ